MRHFLAFLALSLTVCSGARADDAQIARGRALATVGDCIACHTVPGGQNFAGGRDIETPFGIIRSANITPDRNTGIGNWSNEDFAHAMKAGIAPGGRHLYPAFPYPFYARVSREDVDAIFAYLRTLPPASHTVERNSLRFPYSIRPLMNGWNALFLDDKAFQPDPKHSAEFNRGAYLAEGLGHCGACHTPLNSFGANKDSQMFEGSQLEGWTVPNITADPRVGIGAWSVEEIVAYLQRGANRTNLASGPMADVVAHSTAIMPVEDLRAIAVFLKERGGVGPVAPALLAENTVGRAIFVDTCGACHGRDGAGVSGIFPRLAGNPVVVQTDPSSLVRVVLSGAQAVATAGAPTGPIMPSFGYRLNDAQVAAVLTYIRNSWGNAAPAVEESTVRGGRPPKSG